MSGKGKKKRVERPYTARFVDSEIEELFDQYFLTRSIIRERGFSYPGIEIGEQIKNRGWGKFTATPRQFPPSVIREFYCNAIKHANFQVYVRGRTVDASREAINEFYSLAPQDEKIFSKFSKIDVDFDEVLRFLCHPNLTTDWKRSGDRITNFPSSGMNPISKAWHYFIIAKFMPSNNTSEVTKERAALNFAIQKGMPIDVGYIINRDIFAIQKYYKVMGGLGHTSLVFELCDLAGVRVELNEEREDPRTAITEQKLSVYGSKFGKSTQAPSSPSHPSSLPSSSAGPSRRKGKEPIVEESRSPSKSDLAKINRRVEYLMKEQKKGRQDIHNLI